MKRFGCAFESSRVNVTAPAATLAFFEMKRPPVDVPAQSVELSLVARPTPPRLPPLFEPNDASGTFGASGSQAPQVSADADTVNTGQFASSYAWTTPRSHDRRTCSNQLHT